jgi:transposase-like protein
MGPITRGKIAFSDRPRIVARYESGESIASISRSFGCTAPAIRYLIKRTKGTLSRDSETGTRGASARAANPPNSALSSSLDILRTTSVPLGRTDLGASGRTIAKAGSTDLNRSLRDRVSSDIAAFLVAFDAATRDLNIVNIDTLVEATDRLLQACARTRMELDRLRTLPSRVRSLPDREAKRSESARTKRRRK